MKKRITRRPSPAEINAICPSPVLSRLYANRGLHSPQDINYHLQHLAQPASLKGLEEGLQLLTTAITQNQRLLVIGDFDADGATSTAVAIRCLRALGASHAQYLVPNRFKYGYGLTPEIVEDAQTLQPQLIITVDNGIASLEGVAKAQALGIKVLITDHHLPGAQLPGADAIINPNQPGCLFPTKNLAGVGVIFHVMCALRTRLKSLNWFNPRPIPNFTDVLDIVALGTVADVVPLDYINRILVYQGLERIKKGAACEGIKALLQVAKRAPSAISAQDLGFVVGPRLNAAGRLDDMSLGIECLLTDSPQQALEYAQALDDLNKDRRAIETGMQAEALVLLNRLEQHLNGEMPTGITLFHAEWHQGVIGILASRIKDRLHRPVIVFALDEQGHLKGSGRSIPGFHLRDALDEVASQNPDILKKFGGHAMAAGLSLAVEHLDAFSKAFNQVAIKHLGKSGLEPCLMTDGSLAPDEFSLELAQEIAAAGPWGQAFPAPSFDGEFTLVQQRIVGEKHLKLLLSPLEAPEHILNAIAFNINLNEWPNPKCQQVKLVYTLASNTFRDETHLQLMVDYIEPIQH